MGCKPSRPVGPGDNDDDIVEPPHVAIARFHASQSSLRNLNTPRSLRPSSVPSSRGSTMNPGLQAAAASRSNAQPVSDDRPNQPLTPIPAGRRSKLPDAPASPTTAKSRHSVKPPADSSSQTWTRRRLNRERAEWWDTRVTHSLGVWGCLRLAAEALQQGDVATAQTLIDAQECTCPNGQLWSQVWDPRGGLYEIPEWLIVEPAGIIEDGDLSASATDDKAVIAGSADDQVFGPGHEYVVRARLSSTAQDIRIPVGRQETIASIRERLKTHAQLDSEERIRIVYGGREYEDHEVLEANGFWSYENDYVLSCLVVQKDSIPA